MRPRTLRRIESEDGSVVEEQERFAELVSSEYLLQNLIGVKGQKTVRPFLQQNRSIY